MKCKTAIIIGSGFGALAACVQLQHRGYQCQLFEASSALGGRAQQFHQDGFTFDAGPTVITARYLFDELFHLLGTTAAEHVTFKPLDPWYTYHFSDGSDFAYGGSTTKTLSEIARIAPNELENYQRFFNFTQKIFDIGYTQLADQPFLSMFSLLKQLPALIRLRSYQSVRQLVAQFFTDDRLIKAFSVSPLLVGGNPYSTTAIYLLIHYLENQWGVDYAMGGTGQIVQSLISLLQQQGLECHTKRRVIRIQHDSRNRYRVCCADGKSASADMVVYNGDPYYLFNSILENIRSHFFRRMLRRRYKYSMSLFIAYFGTSKQYRGVGHHTIVLQDNMRAALNNIFELADMNFPVNLYLHRPTATDPHLAPPGCDAFYVLVPVSHLQKKINWQLAQQPFWQHIKEQLESSLLPKLSEHIMTEKLVTPQYFSDELLSHYGASFGIQPLLTQSAWFRYLNKPFKNESIYLVGANTHPGAGLPGVINSAKVMGNIVDRTY